MSTVSVTIGRRPKSTGRPIAARTPAPAVLVLVDDVEAAASANAGRCTDDNPYN